MIQYKYVKNIKTIQSLSLCCAPSMAKVDYFNELQENLSTTSSQNGVILNESQAALELCIDVENSPTAQAPSLESSMSTYDSMMQTLNDELNDGANVEPDLMDFEDADLFNMDCATAMTVDYDMNYTMKQLKHIAGYYGIKCKSRKVDIIQDIVAYETESANHDIVGRRKRLFHYMTALKNDEYFKTFVIL
jgi:hypothetical protein